MNRAGGDKVDEKQAKLTHFTGLIRVIVGLVLLFIIVFSFTRWAMHRRDANNAAEKAAKNGSSIEKKDNTPDVSGSTKRATDVTKSPTKASNQLAEVPSGIDDSLREPSNPTRSVPNTGIDSSFGLTVISVGVVVYLLVYMQAQKRSLLGRAN